MQRATTVRRALDGSSATDATVRATAILAHDERHLRRKVIALTDGSRVLVDLPEPVALAAGDALVLEDGGIVIIGAAEEELLEVTARDPIHLTELAWHIGNRHLPAAISADRILILRDHVIRAMLEGLGARVRNVVAGFEPVRGASSGGGHGHGHGHGHDHHDGHHHHGHHHGG
jgi:urease accessory protein